MPAVHRQLLRGDRVVLVARQRAGGRLDRLSVGLDLPPELAVRPGDEVALSVRVRLVDDRPELVHANVRSGAMSWATPVRPEAVPA